MSLYKRITIPLPKLTESEISKINEIEDGVGVYNKSCFINRLRVPKIKGVQFPHFDADKVIREVETIKTREKDIDNNMPKQKVKRLERK